MPRERNPRSRGPDRRMRRTRRGHGLSVAQDPRSAGARDAGHRPGAFGHARIVVPPAGCDTGHRHGANAPSQLTHVYRTRSSAPMDRTRGSAVTARATHPRDYGWAVPCLCKRSCHFAPAHDAAPARRRSRAQHRSRARRRSRTTPLPHSAAPAVPGPAPALRARFSIDRSRGTCVVSTPACSRLHGAVALLDEEVLSACHTSSGNTCRGARSSSPLVRAG
jgi:hypothetical protein